MALYLYRHICSSRFDSSLQEEALGKQEVCQVHSGCLYLPRVNPTWGGTVGVSHGRPAGFTDCAGPIPQDIRNACWVETNVTWRHYALCLYSRWPCSVWQWCCDKLREAFSPSTHVCCPLSPGDNISLGDTEDLLKRSPSKDGQRPASGDSIATEPWLRPGTSETLRRFMAEQPSPAKLSPENTLLLSWQGLSTAHGWTKPASTPAVPFHREWTVPARHYCTFMVSRRGSSTSCK